MTSAAATTHDVVVLQHGLFGTLKDFTALVSVLQAKNDRVIVLRCPTVASLKTARGIPWLARALSEYVIGELRPLLATGNVNLSFIGHSLGGLIVRYALPLIEEAGVLDPARTRLVSYISICSPHIGIRRTHRAASWWSKIVMLACSLSLIGPTGRELMLLDNNNDFPDASEHPSPAHRTPLLRRMATEPRWLDLLRRFDALTALGCLELDWQVPFLSAVMAPSDLHDRDTRGRVVVRHRLNDPRGVHVLAMRGVDTAFVRALTSEPYRSAVQHVVDAEASDPDKDHSDADTLLATVPTPHRWYYAVGRVVERETVARAVLVTRHADGFALIARAAYSAQRVAQPSSFPSLGARVLAAGALLLRNVADEASPLAESVGGSRVCTIGGAICSIARNMGSVLSTCVVAVVAGARHLAAALAAAASVVAGAVASAVAAVAAAVWMAFRWIAPRTAARLRRGASRAAHILRVCGVSSHAPRACAGGAGRDCDDTCARWASCSYDEFVYDEASMATLGALPWRRVHLWIDSVVCHEIVVGKVEMASAFLGFTAESAAAATNLVADVAMYDFGLHEASMAGPVAVMTPVRITPHRATPTQSGRATPRATTPCTPAGSDSGASAASIDESAVACTIPAPVTRAHRNDAGAADADTATGAGADASVDVTCSADIDTTAGYDTPAAPEAAAHLRTSAAASPVADIASEGTLGDTRASHHVARGAHADPRSDHARGRRSDTRDSRSDAGDVHGDTRTSQSDAPVAALTKA